ncbi:MAG TPA: MFS transporter [Ktedonobacterales bacterium]
MSMETTASKAHTGNKGAVAPSKRSLGQLVAISIFWFALNFHWTAINSFIIPPQVVALLYRAAPAGSPAEQTAWVNDNKALALAIVVAPGLVVALLANPYFGLLSDRTPGRFGRRRPYVLGGTLLNVVGLAIMALLPTLLIQDHSGVVLSASMLALIGGLMITQVANNGAAAPFHALLPDLVPAEQRGLSSGIMGLAYWLGTIGGALLPFIFGLNFKQLLDGQQSYAALQQQIVLAYAAVAVVIVLMAVLTVVFVHETPWQPASLRPAQRAVESHTLRDLGLTVVAVIVISAVTLSVLRAATGSQFNADTFSIVSAVAAVVAGIGAARAFDFRPRRNPDFSWVVLTRMILMIGVYIVLTYLQFYMADVAHTDPNKASSEFLIVLTLTATLSTVFAGWASDHFGRKRMVYISGAFMAVVGVAFILAPYLVPGQILTLALVAGAVFGLGFGAYISVDWALVADVLPSEATFARDMGVWNIGITIAGASGTVIGGWLLTVGKTTGTVEFGYTLLFAGFVLFCVLGTVTVRFIKGVA